MTEVAVKPTSLRAEIVADLIQKSYQEGRTGLDLSHKLFGLELPKQLGILAPILTNLNLTHNEFETLPDHISLLVNLASLDISYNCFIGIPSAVYKLGALQELYISNNEIKLVTGEIAVLAQLEKLDLSRNQIQDISPRLVELKNLRDLDLGYNEIQFLPSEFAGLIKLKTLEVKSNPLQFPPKQVADKGIEAILSFLGDKTIGTISKNNKRHSNRQAITLYGTMRKSRAFSLEQVADQINEKLGKKKSVMKESIPEVPGIQSNQQIPKRRAVASYERTMKRHTMSLGIHEPSLQENFTSLSPHLASVKDTRKKIVDAKAAAMASAGEKKAQKELTILEQQQFYEINIAECAKQINEVMSKPANNAQLMELSQKRNNLRVEYAKQLNSNYVEMSRRALENPEDLINRLDSVSKADLNTFAKVIENVNKSMKKTNEAAKMFLQAIEEEVAVYEENKEWIKQVYKWFYSSRGREQMLDTQDSLTLAKKVAYYDALRVAELEKVPTPTDVASMIKLFIEMSAETNENSKMAVFTRMFNSRPASAASVLCYEVNLAHQLEQLALKEYPEMRFLYPDIVANVQRKADAPFFSYRLDDYEELISLDSDKRQSVGVNVYGVKCLIKKYPIVSQKQAERSKKAIEFLYRHKHKGATSVNGGWFEDKQFYVEERLYTGKTLREWLNKNPNAAFNKVRDILYRVLETLAYLHRFDFTWGQFNAESIVLVSPEEASDSDDLFPVLTNFDYSFNEKLTDTDPAEAQQLGRKVFTKSADMFYYGMLLCEVLSSEHILPVGILVNGRYDYVIPPVASRFASKHLNDLIQLLVNRRAEKRSHSSSLLPHPYFSVDKDVNEVKDETKKDTKLVKFYLDLYSYRMKSKGLLIVDLSSRDNSDDYDHVEEVLQIIRSIPVTEIEVKSLSVVKLGSSDDQLALFFKYLAGPNEFMEPVGRELPHSQMIIPDSRCEKFDMFESLGRLLRRLVFDAYPIPPVFPPVFFKLLLGKKASLNDCELTYPFEVAHHMASSNKFNEEIKQIAAYKFNYQLSRQMDAIRQGFFGTELESQLKQLSVLELVKLFHTNINDNLDAELLKSAVTDEGFDGDAATLDFFWMWIDSLSQDDLRKFMFYATGRYCLHKQEDTKCGHANYVLERDVSPILYIHHNLQSVEVQRPFAHHLEIPPCQDYVQLQQKMVKAMNAYFADEDLYSE